MARVPNAYADETVESLIRDELEKGNIPLVCETEGCKCVSGLSPAVALRERDEAHNVVGAHERCGGGFVVADLTQSVEN